MRFLALAAACGALLWSGLAEARIHRDYAVIRAFKASNVCPATGTYSQRCRGFEVDHQTALCLDPTGDVLGTLQYLSVAEHRAKTRLDVKACAMIRRLLR